MKRANDIGCLSDSLPNKLSLSRARALSLSRALSLLFASNHARDADDGRTHG